MLALFFSALVCGDAASGFWLVQNLQQDSRSLNRNGKTNDLKLAFSILSSMKDYCIALELLHSNDAEASKNQSLSHKCRGSDTERAEPPGALFNPNPRRNPTGRVEPSHKMGTRPSHRYRPSLPAPAHNEVENEIDILSSLRGLLLVNLLGFSASEGGRYKRELVLVMEYMPNRTLYDLPHSNPCPPSWAHWMRLALQTAKALLTLHSTRPLVIHHDVKSTNILLDRNLDARLGDFGLTLYYSSIPSSAAAASVVGSTPLAGTLGYLDPSYVTPDSLSTKTDAFSFRILLLEIMSGQGVFRSPHPPTRDPAARRRLARFAASCVRFCRECRPSMDKVVDQLKALSSLSWNSSRTLSSNVWNGLVIGNPSSFVDTQGGAISKLRLHGGLNSELQFINEDEVEESEPSASAAAVDEEKENEEKTPIFAKKPPSAAAKGSHPSRNAKVFSEAGTRKSRNLMELMAGGCFVSNQRSIISR
uniref:Protein kinase domain-containing protein n=1 Tax=Ananas comosus var. bracteatus TaxID=296719 RepID=A0A6V7PGQ9_ANACO|nr:unnamed protein product [Ananas comosus var. bracteatus]